MLRGVAAASAAAAAAAARVVRRAHTKAGTAAAAVHRPQRVGVSFDIDGVLVRGLARLPHARESLLRLQRAGIPYVFLTNGGGEPEAVKAGKVAEALQVPVHPEQVILSHTPLRPVVAQYADQKVLVLGCRDVMGVARSYGARHAVDIPTLAADDPARYPFHATAEARLPAATREAPFAAVFILHDPTDWAPEVQITLDVIRGGWPLGSGGHKQTIPVYASNPDLVFAGTYPEPRLACGAFTLTLKTLWRAVTGTELAVAQIGKPTKTTFDYTASAIARWAALAHATRFHDPFLAWAAALPGGGHGHSLEAAALPPSLLEPNTEDGSGSGGSDGARPHAAFDRLYHIGDNPAADMRGALNAGDPWRGILVRTGVFRGAPGTNDRDHPGAAVVDGVADAVSYILSHTHT